jgi:hypothetical protein
MSLAEDLRENVEALLANVLASESCLLNGWVLTANYVTEDGVQATAVTVAENQPLPSSMGMVLYASTWFDVLQRDIFMNVIVDMDDDDDEEDSDV